MYVSICMHSMLCFHIGESESVNQLCSDWTSLTVDRCLCLGKHQNSALYLYL